MPLFGALLAGLLLMPGAAAAPVELPRDAPVPVERPAGPRGETDAPDTGATPQPRPDDGAQAAPAAPDERPPDDEAATVPAPDAAADDAQDGAEAERTAEPAGPTVPDTPRDLACEAALRALSVGFERREPIAGEGACGVAHPYAVREIQPGVLLKPDSRMTCHTALALAAWIRQVVQPAAASLGEDVRLAEVTHASTYVCRSRNNQPDARISEHAKGRAIDVTGFDLDGHDPIPVVPRADDGDRAEAFQRAVRGGACLHFTTVLGPGTDAYHDDHLHLDVKQRSGGYRLCQ